MGNITSLMRRAPNLQYCLTEFSYDGNHLISSENYSSSSVGVGNGLDYTACSENNPYLYDANGNETRNMSHNISHIRYNLLNLPDSVSFADGNMLTFIYMADGRRVGTDSHTGSTPLVLPGMGGHGGPQVQTAEYSEGDVTADFSGFNRLEIPGGYLTFGSEFYQFTPSQGGGLSFDGQWTRGLASHFYVTDYKGSVVAVCSGETGAVEQTASYMPSGVVFSSTNYGTQPYKFCGKEDITMHGFNMYDSQARYQYSRFPRFTTMDPLAEWDYATSPYAYCRNDFVNLVDPWGLDGWPGRMNYVEEAVVWGYRRGTIAGDIYGAEFSLWCDNVNRYRNPLPGGFTTYQNYVDRYDPNLYGGGGGVSKEDWEMLTKIWKAENTGVSSIVNTLDNQTVKTAEISYLITEKIDNKPLTSAFIDWHASSLKYIKVAKSVSKGLSFFFLACDAVEGFVDDDYTFGYHTLRNLITGAGGMIGAHYGGIYGAKWGAIGHLPGAVAGGIAGTISGALAGEYISGWMFDEIYYSF